LNADENKSSLDKIIKQLNKLQNENKIVKMKHKTLSDCASQNFSVTVDCLQQLQNIKDGGQICNDILGDTIEK
jgi:hypothetical protein